MKIIKNVKDHMQYYKQEAGDWCLYACTQMLLTFNGIAHYNQNDLHQIHLEKNPQKDMSIKIFIDNLNKKINNRIKYINDVLLPMSKIENFIDSEFPVYANIYLEPNGGMGHSLIIYGYDDKNHQILKVIDPEPNNRLGRGIYYDLSYTEFDQYFNRYKQAHVGNEIFVVQ